MENSTAFARTRKLKSVTNPQLFSAQLLEMTSQTDKDQPRFSIDLAIAKKSKYLTPRQRERLIVTGVFQGSWHCLPKFY